MWQASVQSADDVRSADVAQEHSGSPKAFYSILTADSGNGEEAASQASSVIPSHADAAQEEELWLEGAEALLVSHSMDSTHDDEDWIASSSELSTQDCQKSSDASILQEYDGSWSLTQERPRQDIMSAESMNGYVAETRNNDHEQELLPAGVPAQQQSDDSSQLFCPQLIVQQPWPSVSLRLAAEIT
ncbi:unnamed protein product [Symbiodinium sp. KB8]|nr:unnamed protein product [Symbiodinium sp. KB8]